MPAVRESAKERAEIAAEMRRDAGEARESSAHDRRSFGIEIASNEKQAPKNVQSPAKERELRRDAVDADERDFAPPDHG